MKPVEVFISSTVWDLLDLRPELAEFLRADGFKVRVSGGNAEEFEVETASDSIETCLTNVARSNVVICIVDRRYGPPLPHGDHKGISATHAEIRHARKLAIPVFTFVRGKAVEEFSLMRRNGPVIKTNWVEPESEKQRERWYGFVKELSALEHHANWSNWYDPFTTCVDLKQDARTRLLQRFPQQSTFLALQPNRLVRMAFIFVRSGGTTTVRGTFKNVGTGPALNITHGIEGAPTSLRHRGGLAEGEGLADVNPDGAFKFYDVPPEYTIKDGQGTIFCEYENRFRDRFRVSVKVKEFENGALRVDGPEEFCVWNGEQWVRPTDQG